MSVNIPSVDTLFQQGVHFGYHKSRRHPSMGPHIVMTKNLRDLLDLNSTIAQLTAAIDFLGELKKEGKTILWVGAKPEARAIIKHAGMVSDMPTVTQRWIGGTLTNFDEVRGRVQRLIKLRDQKEKGELVAKTKKELLMLDREIERLEFKFGGLEQLEALPAAVIVVDPKKEHIAVKEANALNIPVIALANSDCPIENINLPIAGNDAATTSIDAIIKTLAQVWE